MNIFALHNNPYKAADLLYLKHTVKMALETTQILCTNICALDPVYYNEARYSDELNLYLPTHVNHPVVVWARESWQNFLWLSLHGERIFHNYTSRYQRTHRSFPIFQKAVGIFHEDLAYLFAKTERTPFAKCVPESFQTIDDSVIAYQKYYLFSKDHLKSANEQSFFKRLEEIDNNEYIY